MRRTPAPPPPAPDDFGRMLTTAQVAERLGLSTDTVCKLILRGELPSVKLGTRLGQTGGIHRIPERCVNEWIARNLTTA